VATGRRASDDHGGRPCGTGTLPGNGEVDRWPIDRSTEEDDMTQPPFVPIVPAILAQPDEQSTEDERDLVGASDADADAVRTGAEVDRSHTTRDSDGVPVGRADLEADVRRGRGEDDD
jgi:hypothetical protein